MAVADAALNFFTPEQLWTQSAPFNPIFFGNLLAPNPRYRQTLETYLNRAWNEARDPKTGLFTKGGVGLYGDYYAKQLGSLGQAHTPNNFRMVRFISIFGIY